MHVELDKIWIPKDRQRKEIDVSDLLESIPIRGILTPIIVNENEGEDGRPFELIAGERRLTAARQIGLPSIPVRLFRSLTPSERKIIELEENFRRKNLTWQEQCAAFLSIHTTLSEEAEGTWSYEKSAAKVGVDRSLLYRSCQVAKELGRPQIAKCESFNQAFNLLTRENERAAGDVLSSILSTTWAPSENLREKLVAGMEKEEGAETSKGKEDLPFDLLSPPAPKPIQRPEFSLIPASESILQESFLDWAPSYSGAPFNFIHCDFPYGANVFGGKWSGRQTWEQYKDTPDIYFALIECLCKNLDRVMAHSGHLMFWLSADVEIQAKTLEIFSALAPTLSFSRFPLYWLKSDNIGIVPDPKREPRRIVETALIASREDRFLIRPVSNAIAAQTSKEHHPHTKPEAVLKHFFSMFVDSHTRLLDPTCGGGSSLRAAEAMGAESVLGLEISDEYVGNARKALDSFRVTRRAAEIVKERNISQ